MTTSTVVEQYETKQGEVWGHQIRVVSYRLSDKFICLIENLDVGAAICRVSADTRMDALQLCLSKAMELVGKTAPPRSLIDAMPGAEFSPVVFIDRIVMEIEGLPVAYTVVEFNELSPRERMTHIMSGNITFYAPSGETIAPGEAIELLRVA